MSDVVTPVATRERAAWYRWYALGVLVVIYASSYLDRQIVGILLEPIKQELGVSDTAMGFLIGMSFTIFYATLGMPIAMLADRYNRRNIITVAITIWSGMTVLCGYAHNFLQLALARVGVGVGEAGSSPPSHSIISDLFPQKQRGTAMGIFAFGTNIGLLIAFLAGGWMSENWGWRMTFVAVGLPGLALALLLRLTVDEPRRGAMNVSRQMQAAPPFKAVVRYMWGSRATRHIVFGSTLAGFVSYGFVLWLPAFFARSHGLGQTEIGMVLAFMAGVVGGIGTLTAGKLADTLASRDIRWFAWIVGIAKIAYMPFLIAFFLSSDLTTALWLYAIPAFLGGFFVAPTFAMVQSLVRPEMRAVASAIFLFLLNIIGGLSPQLVGILSDVLRPEYGQESLRYALMIFGTINIWCGIHYYLGARNLQEDIERAGN